MKNILSILSLVIFTISLKAQCSSGYFYSQASIDSFPVRYPGCSVINSQVIIQGEDITNIDSLYSIKQIDGSLRIRLTNLVSLKGLDGLESIGGDLFIETNRRLRTLEGLYNLKKIGNPYQSFGGAFFISDCDSLMTLGNFSVLNYIGILYVTTCNQLSSLGAFRALRSLSNLNLSNCPTLLNLNGLDSLHNVDHLTIRNNISMSSFCGLESLEVVSSNLSIIDNFSLTSFDALQNIELIGGHLTISGCSSLFTLMGLHKIKSLKSLTVMDNESLISFGLDSLQFITQNLKIVNNANLSEITSLKSLTYIGSSLIIDENTNLVNLRGLDSLVNLSSISINSNYNLESILALSSVSDISQAVQITNNHSLAVCNIPAICEYLMAKRSVKIENNFMGCENPNDVVEACGISLPCPYQVTLNNQEDIDNFYLKYPQCRDIYGHVLIRDSFGDITDLYGLHKIDSIRGNLIFDSCQVLQNFEGLDNLRYIGGNLHISNNHFIHDLKGLEKIIEIKGSLIIQNNQNLIHLDGLSGIASNLHSLQIFDNNSLQNISQLDGYRLSGYTQIINNLNLSFCNIRPVCFQLTTGEPINIGSNRIGCLTLAEVSSSCYDCLEEFNLILNSPDGIFRAVDTISTRPGQILTTFGLYDAPIVEFRANFEVSKNASLVVKNKGCRF